MERRVEPPVDAALVAGLASQAGHLASIAEDLITTVRRDRAIKIFGSFIALVLVAGAIANFFNTQATRKNTSVIVSCTDPDGDCYKESRKSSAASIKLINDTVVATVACGNIPSNDTFKEIQECVIATLAKN